MGRRVLGTRPSRNATGACAVAFAVASVASGCSFMFSEGAPDNHPALATFSCGDQFAPPVVDTVVGGVSAYIAAHAAATEDATVAKAFPQDQGQVRHDQNVAIGLFTTFAALDLASALYGYSSVKSCREAKESRAYELARARVLPPPYGVAPYGMPPPLWPPPPPPALTAPPPPPVTEPAPPSP